MKCDGAARPPCSRCSRTGRTCILAPPARSLQAGHDTRTHLDEDFRIRHVYDQSSNILPPIVSPSLSNNKFPVLESSHRQIIPSDSGPNNMPCNSRPLSDLPSIYSTPPAEVVSECSYRKEYPMQTQSGRKRKRSKFQIGRFHSESPLDESEQTDWHIDLPRQDVREMIHLYVLFHDHYA